MNVNDFIQILIETGWKIKLKDKPAFNSKVIQDHYGSIPDSYSEFLSKIDYCRNADDNIWFLSEDDFEEKSDSAFVWNEFELQSLETANDNEELIPQIKKFWNSHLPILISVKDHYSYLAISNEENEKGIIVQGSEPEYEETTKICSSFEEFIKIVAENPPLLTRGLLL